MSQKQSLSDIVQDAKNRLRQQQIAERCEGNSALNLQPQRSSLAQTATSADKMNVKEESTNGLMNLAIFVLTVSVVGFLWGRWYTNEHPFLGMASVFGASNPTYSIASNAMILGVLGFLLGLILLIAALVRGGSRKTDAATQNTTAFITQPGAEAASRVQQPTSRAKFCPGCGTAIELGSAFCAQCGAKL